jgi:hypothetical protein
MTPEEKHMKDQTPRCLECGLELVPSNVLGRHIHLVTNTAEVRRSLNCGLYGKSVPGLDPEPAWEDIPAIVRKRWAESFYD